jgi:nucleoside-diphosphate-sugar epimerase
MKTSPVKRVLVTGGTGFIGRHVAAGLQERGFEVHLLVRDAESARSIATDAQLHSCDLFDDRAVEEAVHCAAPTHLLHLAWTTAHGKFWTSSENLDWVRASLSLVRHFAASGGRRIVCAGTCAEYDWSRSPCHERDTPLRPATLYGTAKNALRAIIESFAAVEKLSFAWGRLFFLYGPHENPARLVPGLMAALADGRPALCQCGAHVRDFLHAADAADAFAALVDCEVQGPVNVASGRPLSLGTLTREIARIAGRSELAEIGRRGATPENPAVLTADVTRLSEEVGWRPRISLERGLEQLWSQFALAAPPLQTPAAC